MKCAPQTTKFRGMLQMVCEKRFHGQLCGEHQDKQGKPRVLARGVLEALSVLMHVEYTVLLSHTRP